MIGSPAWSGGSADRRPLLAWTLAFWAATYALFTLRSQLTPDEVTIVLSGRRLVSTVAGAALFAMVIVAARHWIGMGRRGLRLLWTVVPASLIVLCVRAVVNDLWGAAIPFITDVRWMLTWASYFSLGLGLFLLAHRDGTTGRLMRHAAAVVGGRRATPAIARVVPPPAPDDVEWVIDALAAELARAPAASRTTLLSTLQQRAGYELADPADPLNAHHNRRYALVARLAARVGETTRSGD
jgi:hypothetical protein